MGKSHNFIGKTFILRFIGGAPAFFTVYFLKYKKNRGKNILRYISGTPAAFHRMELTLVTTGATK